MNELHLFAGIGGGILGGMLLGHRCVGAVELDKHCRAVLEQRQRDGIFEQFPIHDDVRTFDGEQWCGRVDVVCGGFPCQPWSSAGKRLGAQDPRHLWPEFARIVAECRPAFVFAENVALGAFAEPFADLCRMGYEVPPAICLDSRIVGAPFRRSRWWLLARRTNSNCQPMLAVDAEVARMPSPARSHWWDSDDGVAGVADGATNRVDRLAAAGNAQLPAMAAAAFRMLYQGLA